MRVFAGPNGSGKTTIINNLRNQFKFGTYVNADDIEAELRTRRQINFGQYNLVVNDVEVAEFFRNSKLSPVKHQNPSYWRSFDVSKNLFLVTKDLAIDSYLAADLAEFIRGKLVWSKQSLTYETVMSHPAKVDFMQKAKEQGYRVYLYFIVTEDPDINISRVNLRVTQEGHFVNPDVVRNRYFKSLGNLKAAIKHTNRAYLFDNSGRASFLVAEVTEGIEATVIDPEKTPNWFKKYLLD
jgi:predicted ABC-type ATPase